MCGKDPKQSIDRLLRIMADLRSERGCPWDREQTIDSLKPNLIEECYEAIDAIESGDPQRHKEELGDILLQVIFHSQIRSELGDFDFGSVVECVCDKLVRRHPHVFGDEQVADADEVLRNWERIKREEKGTDKHASTFRGLPRAMPALQKADHVQARAARLGFDWDSIEPVIEKVEEELLETKEAIARKSTEEAIDEVGDLLFATVNLTRFIGTDAETALHSTIEKFVNRFQYIEDEIHGQGKSLTDFDLEELDSYWQKAKAVEKSGGD